MSDTRRTADCARAELLGEQAIDGRLDSEATAWLTAHRQVCPDCRAVAEALEGDGPLWQALEAEPDPVVAGELAVRRQVIDHLAGRPVEALPLENRPRLGLMLVGVALAAALVLAFGVRSDFAARPWYQVLLPAALLLGGFFVALFSFDRLRAHRGARAVGLGVLIGAPLLFLLVALTMSRTHGAYHSGSVLGPALGCGSVGLVIGLAVLIPAIVLARRGMAGPSQLGAVLLGVAAASVGVGALHLRCGMVALDHVLLGHGLIMLLFPVAALVLRGHRRLA